MAAPLNSIFSRPLKPVAEPRLSPHFTLTVSMSGDNPLASFAQASSPATKIIGTPK